MYSKRLQISDAFFSPKYRIPKRYHGLQKNDKSDVNLPPLDDELRISTSSPQAIDTTQDVRVVD